MHSGTSPILSNPEKLPVNLIGAMEHAHLYSEVLFKTQNSSHLLCPKSMMLHKGDKKNATYIRFFFYELSNTGKSLEVNY